MDPVSDRNGKHVSWLGDDLVYDKRDARAFILNISVYSYDDAWFVGFFEDGFFRDRSARAIAFVRGARGKPSLPTPETPQDNSPRHQSFSIKVANHFACSRSCVSIKSGARGRTKLIKIESR
ncbi:MAG TPA: hypothetical protein VE131_16115 [Terriglobales bacterium]|nr:hypothetical protein [Terriglobales bacterium]